MKPELEKLMNDAWAKWLNLSPGECEASQDFRRGFESACEIFGVGKDIPAQKHSDESQG